MPVLSELFLAELDSLLSAVVGVFYIFIFGYVR